MLTPLADVIMRNLARSARRRFPRARFPTKPELGEQLVGPAMTECPVLPELTPQPLEAWASRVGFRSPMMPKRNPAGPKSSDTTGIWEEIGWGTWIRTKINGVRVRETELILQCKMPSCHVHVAITSKERLQHRSSCRQRQPVRRGASRCQALPGLTNAPFALERSSATGRGHQRTAG